MSQLFVHFVTKRGEPLTVGLAKWVTPPSWVTLLAGPTFLQINHLARPRQRSQGVRITAFVGAVLDNQIT